ncbi:MAG: hypothetical protein HZC55_07430 [Verrucomicrobia bacterium]|nr:hypothetical protein [Verrucomicrobiota bacterium]
MRGFLFAVAASALAVGAEIGVRFTDGPDLNLGFDAVAPTGLPAGWRPRSIGAEAEYGVDTTIVRDGRYSARINAREDTRSYFCSGLIPVTPGERIRASAWVRTAEVPAGKGTVILIADFLVADHAPVGGPTKVAVASQTGDWEQIQGTVTVPPRANFLQVRCGFSYSRGICWWDDLRLEAEQGLTARVLLRDGRLVPDRTGVPVEIINRRGLRDSVTVRLAHGREVAAMTVALSGAFRQRLQLPLSGLSPGRQKLSLEIRDSASLPVWTTGEQTLLVPPGLTLAPLIPTHWVAEDGPPRFEAEVWPALSTAGPAARLVLRVLDSSGRELAVSRQTFPPPGGTDPARFAVQMPGADPGDYRVVLSTEGIAGETPTVEQPWSVVTRGQARTILRSDGFPEVGGRPVFPLGMFNNTARLEESAAAGFNLVHMYNAARVEAGSRPDDQRLKNELDRAARLGLRVLLLVPMEFAAAGQWDAFTRRIRMFRNHPALLAWDEEEGLARGDLKREDLRRIRRILQEEDPHHPFMVGDARDVIGRITDRSRLFPEEEMDLGMWWWYPFPLKSRAADALEGIEAAGPVLEAPTFLTQRATRKPVWVGIQAYRKPGATERYPTPTEYRAQAYLALISGAQGLMWYGGSVTGGLFLNPRDGHWEELRMLVRELYGLEPLLLAPAAPPPVAEPATLTISAGMRRAAGRGLLMVVNRGPQPWQGQIRSPALPDGTVTPLVGGAPFKAKSGAVSLSLGAYETCVLTWHD